MTKRFTVAVYFVSMFFFACFLIWPIYQILKGGLFDANGIFTLNYVEEVFRNSVYVEGLVNAFGVAVFTTILAILIAVPLARIADRCEFWGKGIFMGAVLLPIMLPPFVGAIGIRQILGQYGLLNTVLGKLNLLSDGMPVDWLGGAGHFWGIVVVEAMSLYPILYLNTLATLSNIDPAMEEAAQNLGCRGIKKFFLITFPLMRPGLFAGATIVFIWSFTELGVPLIFDYSRITSVQIFSGLKEIGNNPFPYALVIVMFGLSVAFYGLGKGFFGRNPYVMFAKANQGKEARRMGLWGNVMCVGIFGLVTLVALLPHLSVITVSFSSDWYATVLPESWTIENYKIALGSALTIPAIKNSLFYSTVATSLNLVLGLCIAFVLVRGKLPGKMLLDTLSMLPLAVPGLVMAFGYLAMTQEGRFFHFLNPTENPTALLIIAYSIRKLPFMVRSAVSGLEQISVTYEEAAQNLGCGPLKSSVKITIPLIVANLLSGSLLVFSQTMLEVSDSLILAQKQAFYPITKAIYELLKILGDGPYIACALGVWAMCFLGVTIVGMSMLLGRNLGSIFKV